VTVVLEAAPERSFRGEITEIARLATPRVDEGRVKGFEVAARIEGQDVLLRPGMSARVAVELERIPDAVAVPWEAVFERDGETVVFPVDRWPAAVAVQAGPWNTDFLAVAHAVASEAGDAGGLSGAAPNRSQALSPGTELIAAAPDAATRPWGEARYLEEEAP
jgi:multidrug efflux pump subunit AcrA (membrane-fusion protein)